jgi:signal transduction histidine kinase
LTTALANVSESAVRWGTQGTAAEHAAVAALIAGRPQAEPSECDDAFDEIVEILASRGLPSPVEFACVLGDSGLPPGQLRSLPVRPEVYETAVSFLAYSLQAHEMVAEAGQATRRIEALVADAKTYADPGGAPRQDVDLAEGLDAVLTTRAAKLSGVSVLRDYADVPCLPAHAIELNQVWSNLIDNAVDAMDGTGELRLRIFREGGVAIVEIGDTGPGIPPAILPKLFQPFFTTKDIGKGTGLGLHLSREIIVHRHNGSIDVSSEPGDTRFSVRLPLTSSGIT